MTYPWLEPVAAEFAERLRGGRMAHAILLSGPAGLGKTELARDFLASLLCLEESLASLRRLPVLPADRQRRASRGPCPDLRATSEEG